MRVMNMTSQRQKFQCLPPLNIKQRQHNIRSSKLKTSRNSYEFRVAKSVSPTKGFTHFHNPPFTLEEISFGRCIGRGKGGRVVIGSVCGKDYAIKIISKQLQKYAHSETQILSLFNSSSIVKYYGLLENAEDLYLVLELIRGLDLFHTMRKKRLKLLEIVDFSAQVLLSLEIIHSNGVVYRDLKPENIMVDENSCIQIIDFGLSKVINDERTTTVCGSPEYMAPELIRKSPYGFSVDLWGLGVLIYEMICG